MSVRPELVEGHGCCFDRRGTGFDKLSPNGACAMTLSLSIGWVGVGKMGLPLAGHLLAAGHAVCVFDIAPAGVDALVAKVREKLLLPPTRRRVRR